MCLNKYIKLTKQEEVKRKRKKLLLNFNGMAAKITCPFLSFFLTKSVMIILSYICTCILYNIKNNDC